MRIAVVSRGWWPCIKGGSEKFMRRVADNLYDMGYDVVAVTRMIGGCRPEARYPVVYSRVRLRVPILSSLLFSRWAARTVNRLGVDAALVNAYWGEAAPIYIDEEVAVASVIHDVGLLHSPTSGGRLHNAARLRVLRRVVERSDAIIVPVEAVKRDLVEHLGAPPGKVRVIGFEGVDAPLKRIHRDNGVFDVVCVARFARNKAQDALIEGFRGFVEETGADARLWLVGGLTDPDYYREVLELARRAEERIGRRIEVVADAPSVEEYYELADVCVYPSRGEEGYGLGVAECMGYGKPVVASRVFEWTGVVDEETAVIIEPGDPDSIKEALKKLYASPRLAEELARRGLERVRGRSWRRVAEFVARVLEEIA